MSDVTFTVIENYEPVVDYEEFKKDFLDVNTRTGELKEKYGLSLTRWNKYRSMVCEECGITRKPVSNYHNKVLQGAFPDEVVDLRKGNEFIQHKYGGYCVIKTRNYYFW